MITLGLDLSPTSVGWALIEKKSLANIKILSAGVRVFEAGMEGNMQDGTQKSRNASRRAKRMLRRQHDRRGRRMKNIMRVLQEAKFMPVSANLAIAIEAIDRQSLKRLALETDIKHLAHVVPYRLRADALDVRLDDFELGRALYHLAHRRGFLSNRKTDAYDGDEETGKVKSGISELQLRIEESNARTLGEYFSSIDPETARIRNRYTGRKMCLHEFKSILVAQRNLGNTKITAEFERKLYRAIFHQRPSKSCRNLAGLCPYEKGHKRAPWYHPLTQKCRVLQLVNQLRLIFRSGETRALTSAERSLLLKNLYRTSSLKFESAKKILDLDSKKDPCVFSSEDGEKKSFPGHEVNAKLIPIFGEKRWMVDFSAETQLEAILDIHSYTSTEGLKNRGVKHWKLSEDKADEFKDVHLPQDYAGLSLLALRKILPRMETGEDYTTALRMVYGNVLITDKQYVELPMIQVFLKNLRNPVIERTLTQLRHIVNPVIRKYGKPDEIHIELACDIKKSVKEKKKSIKKMRDQEMLRQGSVYELQSLLSEFQMHTPKRRDIEKYMLWKECFGKCPYTGKLISLYNLFGEPPEFDIEHIIPYSICLDDSFANKTLCHIRENREVKRNQSPFQSYAEDAEKYAFILERVSKFDSPYRNEKLRRFKAETMGEFSDFANRQFNDTCYASKLAKSYLASLYGGTCDEKGQRIMAVSGEITAIVRNYYRLNRILDEGDHKTLSDHRHHAVNAIVLALTSPTTVHSISEVSIKSRRPMCQGDPEPWKGFANEVRRLIEEIKVTHAVSHKVSGQLHQETIYGRIKGEEGIVSYRKLLSTLSDKDLTNIVDPVVKSCVQNKFAELGIYDHITGKIDTRKLSLFSATDNLPRMKTLKGELGPLIKSVRCRKSLSVTQVGTDANPRAVVTGNNHHMEFLETTDNKGGIKWEGVCVSMMEAYNRKRKKTAVVQRDHGSARRFVFSLACGDIIECKIKNDDSTQLYVIRSIPQSKQIGIVQINKDLRKKERGLAFKTKTIEPLRLMGARKVTLTTFGEIRYAND